MGTNFFGRKLTTCNNGRDRNTGIAKGGGIRNKRYGSKGSMYVGKILERFTRIQEVKHSQEIFWLM